MATTKEKIEVMQAYERGEQIQIYVYTTNEWEDVETTPLWDWVNFDYRIKPKNLDKLIESEFKDGDILFITTINSWIIIFKENENKRYIYKYVAVPICTFDTSIYITDSPLCDKEDISEIRFATEEERQQLFDILKENNYHWNDETKTLEILIKPKFKTGDRIRHKLNGNTYKVSSFLSNVCGGGVYNLDGIIGKMIDIKEQDNYELIPNNFDTNDLIPFETKVLVRHNYGYPWKPAIFGYYIKTDLTPYCVVGGTCWRQCIPYEGNEHLLGTTNDCDDFYINW